MLTVMSACNTSQGQSQASDSPKRDIPAFNADSAYAYVEAQTAFGPRVPGSQASRQCAWWMMDKLRSFGAHNVTEQHTQMRAYNGDALDICNISARFNPEAKRRIMLVAHYDSRPWADQEPDPALRNQPIDGANDGASGVGVILELARQIGMQHPKVGVDILLVDAEDYGRRADDAASGSNDDSWCLGTQYWTQNPTFDIADIEYAILLDMVGGKDAVFPREYFSEYSAKDINDMVRNAARAAGHIDRFPNTDGSAVVDDHVYLNMAGIRAIDIIETCGEDMTFNPVWHTHADNIDNIDRATLGAVGQTIMQLIY